MEIKSDSPPHPPNNYKRLILNGSKPSNQFIKGVKFIGTILFEATPKFVGVHNTRVPLNTFRHIYHVV